MALVSCIQDQASYYRKLTNELKSEATIESELTHINQERDRLAQLIETKQQEINSLEKNSKKEFRDVRKLRHLSFRSAAATLSGKKKELVAKEEAKYQLAFENEQRSKRQLEELQNDYQIVAQKKNELERQKHHFENTKGQYQSLVEQIFENKDPAFPLEPQLEAELRNYKDQQRLAERDKGRFKDAESALSDALKDIKKVIRLLDTVINYVPFEIFGGPIIDEEQVAYLEASKRRIWEVQRMLNAARTILPEIPYPQSLDVVTNNGLLNMRFDMDYVDLNWKVKTSQCFGLLATTYRNTQHAMTWVKQYREYTAGAVERLGSVIDSTRNALHNERERIINVVLSGHISDGQSGSSQSGSGQATSDEPPPPVYEAPHDNDQHLNLPNIPTNLTPASSMVSLPMEGGHSPLLSATPVHNPNSPPHPITPVLDPPAIHISNNDAAPTYVSTNTNNPFTRQ